MSASPSIDEVREKATFTPLAVIECYNNSFKTDIEALPITIQGIYQPDSSNRIYGDSYYDKLIEEGGKETLILKVKPILREKILSEKGKLVSVHGTLSRKMQPDRSSLQITFTASFILSAKKSEISQDEIKLANLSVSKTRSGFKGVSLLLKQTLFENKKPTVALLFSSQSVVRTEFYNALGTTANYIRFTEVETTFSNVRETVAKLKQLDKQYDVIALVRGGGTNLEVFSNPELIEAVVRMNSCTVSAVGHAEEKHYLKKVADLAVDTPTALGKFFSDTVEAVIDERNKSKNVLRTEIQKEFIEIIETQKNQIQKQNQQIKNFSTELQSLTKLSTESNQQISNLQVMLKSEKDTNIMANKNVQELTEKIRILTMVEIPERINQATKLTVEQNERLANEARLFSADLKLKTEELKALNLQNIELASRPQGITKKKAIALAIAFFAAGLIISALSHWFA